MPAMQREVPAAVEKTIEKVFRNRIVGFDRIRADKLVPHPENWREHPEEQTSALAWILEKVGFAGAVIVRPLGDGLFQILDGHARAKQAGKRKVPCLVTDLSEEEGRVVVATFDRVGQLAGVRRERLASLLASFRNRSAAVGSLLSGLAAQIAPPRVEFKLLDETLAEGVVMAKCPECGFEFPR